MIDTMDNAPRKQIVSAIPMLNTIGTHTINVKSTYDSYLTHTLIHHLKCYCLVVRSGATREPKNQPFKVQFKVPL